MKNQIAQNKIQQTQERMVSQEDHEFIRSLLSFNKELNIIHSALNVIKIVSERYVSYTEYQELISCFFSSDSTFQNEKTEKIDAAIETLQRNNVQEYSSAEEIRKVIGITPQIILLIWRVGRALLQDKEYSWAYQVLFFLLLLNPSLSEGWMAYGYVNQKLCSPHTSLNSYLIAKLLSNGMRPEIDLLIAECYLNIGDLDLTLIYLDHYKNNQPDVEGSANEQFLISLERRVQLINR